jgi:hypothetical protein
MRPRSGQDTLQCPAGLYAGFADRIACLTEAINQAPTASEKAGPAQDLAEEMDALLACAAYERTNLDCRLCRNLAELRSKTAALVVQAGARDERRR